MNLRGSLLVGLLLVAWCSAAQPYPSRLGRFEVNQKKGCASFTLTLTNLLPGDCTPGKPCVMNFGDNTGTAQNIFTHTYTAAGTYTLSVLYQSIGSDDIVITVDPNIQPNFEIHACSGSRASIKVTDNAYNQYVIDFNNDGTPEYILPFSNNIQTPPFTYAPPGTYTASVRGRNLNSADNCTAKTQPFTTLATLPTPSINTLTSVDNANIKLDFTTAVNIQYRLEIAVNNSTTFQNFKTLYGVSTLDVTDLKLDLNYYCFRLGAYDPCNGSSTYSNTVCTSKFTVTAQSDVNVLTWSTGPAVNYSISRDGNPYATIASAFFNDTDAECTVTYCYRVTNNYGGGRKSISLEKCVTSFSNATPTAINNVSAVATTGAALSWVQDPLFTPVGYSVSRASAGSIYTLYGTTPASPFNDAGYTTAGKYCYKINYLDKCNNASAPGIAVCPIQLNGILDKTNAITVTWSSYRGWRNAVKEYVLRKYDLAGALIKTVTQTDTVFVDDLPDPINQYVRYEVTAIPNEGGTPISLSNGLEIVKNANLYYPTAFTPNKDNLNDGFIVSGQFIVRLNLTIFDRWGVLLFSSDKQEPWDGQSNGKTMPPSVYIWKAEISDRAGRTFSKEGTVALIRN
ncbi:MAG: gliding motility-associated C-terminal domain-containing protein [Cytophagales bacterium]|nr:gliding motility-associated C-terminal domain-containing protein [Cytophagales bacterium]